ncbi:MAG: hypothetical protein PHQ12_07490 [Chthoniobacteraceae bacterium]|nr:hypothetical protein [Chthoniobacteraceae bacterium]
MITITGNTYPVKEQLKALGGRWNADARGWDVADDKAEQARAIVAAAPVKSSYSRSRYARRNGSSYTRFSDGAEIYTNRRGRCEDAPCCGCCS